jgi:membrane protease YdiL (CAAX protease family)
VALRPPVVQREIRWLVVSGFLVFAAVWVLQVSFPGAHYRSYVLPLGLVGSVLFSAWLGYDPDEVFALGIAFGMPMADQLIFVPTTAGRIAEEAVLYLVLPVVVIFLLRRRICWADLGFSVGSKRTMLRTTLLLLGVAVAMSFIGLLFPSMTDYYPIWGPGTGASLSEYIYNETVIGIVMFTGEAFFRGVILFTLARRSFWGAIIFQSLPYAYLHLGKPGIEVPYSLVAGIVFGWANLRSKSILPSWLTHFLGSALFDALVLLT